MKKDTDQIFSETHNIENMRIISVLIYKVISNMLLSE